MVTLIKYNVYTRFGSILRDPNVAPGTKFITSKNSYHYQERE